MSLLQIAEVFGHDTAIPIEENIRRAARCPFLEQPCTKQSKTNPLGICSYTDGSVATIVCPYRFRETGRIFTDAGRAAFGPGKLVLAVPEVRLLEIPGTGRKIGKIDYIIALLDENEDPVDFAALEVQAVYISGKSTREPFEHYLRTGGIHSNGRRRPDFRSSAQKRLMPQLSLKVPVFRRWGKRFFVAVDASFFLAMPKLPTVTEDNAEITWLVYPFERNPEGFTMGEPTVYHTLWDDVLTSLREGHPPTREELLAGLKRAKRDGTIFST
jgi:hypothetical protein